MRVQVSKSFQDKRIMMRILIEMKLLDQESSMIIRYRTKVQLKRKCKRSLNKEMMKLRENLRKLRSYSNVIGN